MIFWERNHSRRTTHEQGERALGLLQTLWDRLWHHQSPTASTMGTAVAQSRGSPVPWHHGGFLELLDTPRMVFRGPPSLPGTELAVMGQSDIAQAAPVPLSRSSPRGNGIFGLISPGSHLRVPGFDSRPSPVIMWLPGKEGSRRNWLLCLAPLQEVFLLGGTKVRAGWEAFPSHMCPAMCPHVQGGDKGAPPPPQHGAAIQRAAVQHTLHQGRGCVVLPVCVLGLKGLLCSRSGK